MRRPGRGFDVLVVGGGISGLTAAYHTALQGATVGLVEAELPGGLVVNVGHLDGYPSAGATSGIELANALYAHLDELGVQHISDTVTGFELEGPAKVASTARGQHRAATIVLAMGAKLTSLAAPGAGRLWQRGVSQCAFCDAGLYRGATVVVIGGGDSALQEALHLAEFAAEVVLVHRRNRLRARKHYVGLAASSAKIQFRWSSEVVEVLGEGNVEGVRLRHVDSREETSLPCKAVFPFVGLTANSQLLPESVGRDAHGRVLVDGELMTTVPGVYAVGALRTAYAGQITNAVSDGSLVAQAIVNAA